MFTKYTLYHTTSPTCNVLLSLSLSLSLSLYLKLTSMNLSSTTHLLSLSASKMCNSLQWIPSRRLRFASRPSNQLSLRLHRLNRRKRNAGKDGTSAAVVGGRREMRMKNEKLYMENQMMTEENEKLRRRVVFLHQENQLLSSKLLQVSQQQQQPPLTHVLSASNPISVANPDLFSQ